MVVTPDVAFMVGTVVAILAFYWEPQLTALALLGCLAVACASTKATPGAALAPAPAPAPPATSARWAAPPEDGARAEGAEASQPGASLPQAPTVLPPRSGQQLVDDERKTIEGFQSNGRMQTAVPWQRMNARVDAAALDNRMYNRKCRGDEYWCVAEEEEEDASAVEEEGVTLTAAA